MDTKEILQRIFYSFFVILSGSLMAMSVHTLIFSTGDISYMRDIGALFVITLLATLAYFVFYAKNELNKKQMMMRHFIYYVLILIITVSTAVYMEWIQFDRVITVMVFVLLVTFVYILVIGVDIYQSKKLADKLNIKLKERYKG